jgi:hypothetical protein
MTAHSLDFVQALWNQLLSKHRDDFQSFHNFMTSKLEWDRETNSIPHDVLVWLIRETQLHQKQHGVLYPTIPGFTDDWKVAYIWDNTPALKKYKPALQSHVESEAQLALPARAPARAPARPRLDKVDAQTNVQHSMETAVQSADQLAQYMTLLSTNVHDSVLWDGIRAQLMLTTNNINTLLNHKEALEEHTRTSRRIRRRHIVRDDARRQEEGNEEEVLLGMKRKLRTPPQREQRGTFGAGASRARKKFTFGSSKKSVSVPYTEEPKAARAPEPTEPRTPEEQTKGWTGFWCNGVWVDFDVSKPRTFVLNAKGKPAIETKNTTGWTFQAEVPDFIMEEYYKRHFFTEKEEEEEEEDEHFPKDDDKDGDSSVAKYDIARGIGFVDSGEK